MNNIKWNLILSGKKEFYPGLNSKTYYILKVDNDINIKHMTNIIKNFNLSSQNITNKHYLGIDYEFNKVSKTDREVALMQINLENDSNNGYIFILYPTELSKENNKILLDLLTNKKIYKILHGSESLDIPYLFNQLLITKENIDNFCHGFYDTKYLCDYLHLESGVKGKCSIYNLLEDNKVITEKKIIELEKIEQKTGPMYLIEIDIHKMSDDILKYALYDVIFLPELLKKFLSKSIVYTQIIPNISCLINNYKRNLEKEYLDLEEDIQNMNINYLFDGNQVILLKDIWETYYWIINDDNKYLENLKEIHYFKKFFEIITKFIVYKNIIKFFKVYKNKYNLVDEINWKKYYEWLSKYPYVNNLVKEYDKEVNNDLKKIIGLNKKIDK
jgi:hypothetical protein